MSIPAAIAALTLATNAMKNNKKKKPKQNKQNNQPKMMMKQDHKGAGYKSRVNSSSPFAQALTDPFAPSSLGCKVPDPFPFPTQSYHLHQTSVFGTEAATTSGSFMYLPSPIFSLVDLTHVNDVTKNSLISSSFTRYGGLTSYVNYGILASTGLGALSGVLESYRVVSWGIKISNLQPELSATGRIILSFIPIGDTVPTYGDINANGFLVAGLTPITGVPSSVLASSNLLQLPTALEFTVGDLLHGDIELSGMYTNNSFWEFKVPQSYTTMFTGYNTGDEVAVTSTGSASYQTVSYKDSTRMKGGCAIAIYFEGIPVNTSAFQVESIYHLEGTPTISSTAATTPVPSNVCKPIIGTTSDVEKGLSSVNSVEKVVRFIDRGANFLNKNQKSLKGVMAAGRGLFA